MAEPIRTGREGVPLTETAEFKAAVSAAAAEAAADAIARFAEKQQGAPSGDLTTLAQSLAMAIADLTHQGNPRDKPVDPKVLAERNAAMGRMHILIAEAKALPKGDPRRPKWKCISKVNLEHMMIDPYKRDPATKRAVPIEFRWCAEPNDAMVPLNELAERIKTEFRASRGNKAEYQKEAQKQVWLSDRGLVIEGAAPARREVQADLDTGQPSDLDLGDGPNDPNASHVRVLGTIHQPARQNHHGEMV